MARAWGQRGKVVAAVMAGLIGFAYGGGPSFVQLAHAQGKPAASKPGAKPAAAPSGGAAVGKVDPKKSYGEGEKKFKAGDYAGALAEFQVADSVKQTPQAARYIGLCHDNLGHYPDAITAYDRFLANVPPKLAEQGEEIKKRVEAIKAMPGKVHVESTPSGAMVTVDAKADAKATPVDLDLAPGAHTLHFSADGRNPMDKAVDVAFASKQDVKAELEQKAPAVAAVPPPPPPETVAAVPPPPPAAPVEKSSGTVPAIITGGLAVVAAGVGTIFGVMALGDKSDFDKTPTSKTADDGENHALIADMAFGVAITLGVTSAVLFLSSGSSTASASNATTTVAKTAPVKKAFAVAPIVTPHGGGAGATWQF